MNGKNVSTEISTADVEVLIPVLAYVSVYAYVREQSLRTATRSSKFIANAALGSVTKVSAEDLVS
jgi:hypothetical protein